MVFFHFTDGGTEAKCVSSYTVGRVQARVYTAQTGVTS